MNNLSEIGARIKKTRNLLTQKEFAESLGVARTYVSNIEYGRTKPSLEFLINISKCYHVSLDWLLLGHDPTFVPKKSQNPLLLEWIQLFDKLSPNAQPLLIGTVKTILENSNLSNSSVPLNSCDLTKKEDEATEI